MTPGAAAPAPEDGPGAPGRGDALFVADVQVDFLPGGALGVAGGDQILPLVNRAIAAFAARGLPVFLSRDWHPPDHVSFRARGGPWPPHCVAGSPGAAFSPALRVPPGALVVDKATDPEREAYSAFEGTDLERLMRGAGVCRVFAGGIATDYCVRLTVLDALRLGFAAVVLEDAVRAVDVRPGDGRAAIEEMGRAGAAVTTVARLLP